MTMTIAMTMAMTAIMFFLFSVSGVAWCGSSALAVVRGVRTRRAAPPLHVGSGEKVRSLCGAATAAPLPSRLPTATAACRQGRGWWGMHRHCGVPPARPHHLSMYAG